MDSSFVAAREFVRGSALESDMIAIISKGRALVEIGISHTSIVSVEDGDWASYVDTPWDASAIAYFRSPRLGMVIIGEDGDVMICTGGKDISEHLPGDAVAIRNARTIDGQVYACGMQRQVFVRDQTGHWSDISAPRSASQDAIGFESVDGYSSGEVYAVGWGGEIWQYDGTSWADRSGLTNLVLTAVCCAPNGTVYAAGQQGVMIHGRGEAWALIDWAEDTNLDFWDLCWFEDHLYVATATGLFTLTGNALDPVDFGDVGPLSCFSLSAAQGVLWSVGPSDVASFDGVRWHRYD